MNENDKKQASGKSQALSEVLNRQTVRVIDFSHCETFEEFDRELANAQAIFQRISDDAERVIALGKRVS